MTAVELSSDAGLAAMVLLGLVLSARYNTVRRWPHRKLPVSTCTTGPRILR